ncbi:hypothetical protein B484DRAFT_453783, partial [Ochromonadaceae sp. CCMP2298]
MEIFKHAYELVSPEQKSKEWYEDVEEQVCSVCPTLSFQQRIIGCFSCLMLGFLISLGSTLVASGIYLFFMGLTLLLAFFPGDLPGRLLWLVLSIFCQFLALVWYSLSYIPFARDVIQAIFREIWCKNCCPTQ